MTFQFPVLVCVSVEIFNISSGQGSTASRGGLASAPISEGPPGPVPGQSSTSLRGAHSDVRPQRQVKAKKKVKTKEEEGPPGNFVLFQGHLNDPLEKLMDAYCSHFGHQQSCVQFRFQGIAGEVVLPRRSARELGFALGDVFPALYWDPELGTWIM